MADHNPKTAADPNWYVGEDVHDAITALPDGGAFTTLQGDVTAIKDVTDALPDDGAFTTLQDAADDALAETEIVEHHLHTKERWFGLANVPDAEVHRGDPIGTTVTPFTMDAGNLTWGNWLQFVGSGDTPTDGVSTYMDMHKMVVTYVERASTPHFIQVAWGASGADALAAGDYSEFVYWAGAAVNREAPLEMRMPRIPVGTKMWIRILAVGKDTGEMSAFMGGHEYLI
jgi:hypothetical protein